MRIFLPDDRKIAAKPTTSNTSSPKSNPSLSPKYLAPSSSQATIQTSNKKEDKEDRHQLQEFNVKEHHDLELEEEERPYKKLKSDISLGSMGGGGRLTSSSTTNNSKLKSSTAHSSGEQNAQQQGQRNNDTIASSLDLRDDELNNDSINNGPHAAVAAAASSPHRSTISSSTSNRRRNDNTLMNPEDDYLEESKQSSSQYIFLGKSNTNDMPAPRLNGPIPGSVDDPATISKSSQEYIAMNNGSDNINVDDENVSVLSRFIHLLRTQHKPPLDMVEMDGDGNCLFRAISLSVYGDATMHLEVRRNCLDFMEREADHFRSFVADEDFDEYIARKRLDGVHGNHTEIQAMSELYNRSIEVFVPKNGIEPINIFHSEYKSADAPIRLAYTDSNHYNAVIDPLLPTAGLGLGLPGLQPGLADKLQLEEAKKVSDESAMEEKMRLAVEESNRASKAREEKELKEALRKSSELTSNVDSDDDLYKKKAMYLSELDQADFDLEQAVLASSLESWQERKPSSRRGLDGRRNRFNNSPRSHRSSSNSPTFRTSPLTASAAASSSSNYAAAASSSAAAASSSQDVTAAPSNNSLTTADEYPASVQELVMNGFELSKVLHAYSLIGDNFDDLLSFLLSSAI